MNLSADASSIISELRVTSGDQSLEHLTHYGSNFNMLADFESSVSDKQGIGAILGGVYGGDQNEVHIVKKQASSPELIEKSLDNLDPNAINKYRRGCKIPPGHRVDFQFLSCPAFLVF